jgi:hypothetical protein
MVPDGTLKKLEPMCMMLLLCLFSHLIQMQQRRKPEPSMVIAWREGPKAPKGLRSLYGAAVSNGNVVYFSVPDTRSILTFTLPDYEWGMLPLSCSSTCFSLAIVNGKLTTVGGTLEKNSVGSATNSLFSLNDNWLGKKWKDLRSPMPTARMCPAAVTTLSHLVVAGGSLSLYSEKLAVVEIMNMDTMEWFQAHYLPQPVRYPQLVVSGDFLLLCDDNVTFSCSFNELLIKSCKPGSAQNSSSSLWHCGPNIPVQHAPTLVIVKGQVLAIGGQTGNIPMSDVHHYCPSTNSWNVVGQMLSPRSHVLAMALPMNEVVVVGGAYGDHSFETEIGECFLSN